jgi:hypothetical protein
MALGRRSQVLNCALVRKRCPAILPTGMPCRKQVTAKQLVTYGACDACAKVAAAARAAAKSSKSAEA